MPPYVAPFDSDRPHFVCDGTLIIVSILRHLCADLGKYFAYTIKRFSAQCQLLVNVANTHPQVPPHHVKCQYQSPHPDLPKSKYASEIRPVFS